MANRASNDTRNVSVGKGVKGGYMFSAPVGTKLPTDYDTTESQLDEAWENLGYISEDGISNAIDSDSDNFVDLNGDTIETASASYTETLVFTLVEQKAAALATEYGVANVTDADGQITANHNSAPRGRRSYVLLLVLRDGRRQTTVIPAGEVTEVGEKIYSASELVGREITVTCYPDENGNCVTDYIQSNESEPPFSKSTKVEKPASYDMSGKNMDDLVGENYEVKVDGTKVIATGDVYKVEGWEAFTKDEQGKYYPVIRFEAPEGSTFETTTYSGKQRKLTFGDDGVFDVAICMDESKNTRDVKITDPDGNESVTYKVDASGCNFTTKE